MPKADHLDFREIKAGDLIEVSYLHNSEALSSDAFVVLGKMTYQDFFVGRHEVYGNPAPLILSKRGPDWVDLVMILYHPTGLFWVQEKELGRKIDVSTIVSIDGGDNL